MEGVLFRNVHTAAKYQWAGLSVHWEVAEFHRTFGLYCQSGNRGRENWN